MHDPKVPETLEGWSVLHQMFRVQWDAWDALPPHERDSIAREAGRALEDMGRGPGGKTALTTLLGHKGDLMVIHFRRGFEELQQADLATSRLRLTRFLLPTTSYVSIVELGMYEMTAQIHTRLAQKGLPAGSQEFDTAFADEMEEQRRRVEARLFQDVPPRRHVCFYPMNKKRGEERNWYTLSIEERARMMREHGLVGRRYAGSVTQIISGSIGFDDWEWGVDLFADDPVVFKKLIYEMRFDEASAWYAEFGPFYVGLQFSPGELYRFMEGEVPRLEVPEAVGTSSPSPS
ncbi:MAG TPA: hydrogen peroxide-dependent heme synthase [Vicinamibacteria bacterium]|jgi:peroxiredoxin|nr:hydrogen peroxide-dependent heme synthase [Vicinamibacteria bacterium]